MNHSVADQLCLACGLCCDGALFKDVELQPGDDPVHLRNLGLPVSAPRSAPGTPRFNQPCAALGADCRCRIYAGRPARCRQFECALFQAVHDGRVEIPTALRTIQQTRRLADKVRALLRALGDTDEQLALSRRFRRTKKRLVASALDDETADRFGDLTLAVHDLNLRLRHHFYPSPSD